ncbi:MAG: TauD/TfdA family dioxygenase [Pirellulales bacterium]
MPIQELEVVESSVVGQQNFDGRPFPAVRECRTAGITLDDACAWAESNKAELVAEASRCGTVMFRGFPLRTAEDFDRFVTAFGLPNFAYEDSLSNAVRVNKTPRVFTANEAPPDVTIFFHHEMAQTPIYPSRLFFFCEQPSATGGATPLCRSDVLWERLVAKCPQFAQDCETKGLRYSNVMPAANDHASGMGRSWQSTLRAQTPQEAEDRLRGLGYSWTWQDDGCLRDDADLARGVRPRGRPEVVLQSAHRSVLWMERRP